jgi:hypothetical protein
MKKAHQSVKARPKGRLALDDIGLAWRPGQVSALSIDAYSPPQTARSAHFTWIFPLLFDTIDGGPF